MQDISQHRIYVLKDLGLNIPKNINLFILYNKIDLQVIFIGQDGFLPRFILNKLFGNISSFKSKGIYSQKRLCFCFNVLIYQFIIYLKVCQFEQYILLDDESYERCLCLGQNLMG
eukprot:TRINITY_DN11713_c0_g1_i2.p10 TRINITY_DN11713_c0_g1~~TRINITY_DN11713_c0_g1_i2.p10  ORF type:complete len:115 (+),score=0.84 TRINITY_DN11713_c0_g1_i2:1643-1987(+)